ncbi:hypothetical protein [Streptomyces sp. TRM49041]|uniref:hypothetical protein n=1 Tax=Streptomyces sp. TRM49041 TaxID=2603216 RepID=UPI0011ED80C9|nr:hypothetical protein [Streptomyces sp. TRM49041]
MTKATRPSLAGRPAGAGRPRPGRTQLPPPAPSASRPPSASPPPSASAAPSGSARTRTATPPDHSDGEGTAREAVPEEDSPAAVRPHRSPSAAAYEPGARTAETGADRRIPVLTLGVGLALVGLGIGFLGVRIRR